ncbi:hypothetical protein ElyMa_006458200 [Elysia marginata]|uniref:Uncharacterized protein n=1 Tax=Elysia marginata TaxID=1093978 RepID=A0AAV4I0G9_9GAST|nr:hypothetical protein ElyMa_006458200 [Elysia marginata]
MTTKWWHKMFLNGRILWTIPLCPNEHASSWISVCMTTDWWHKMLLMGGYQVSGVDQRSRCEHTPCHEDQTVGREYQCQTSPSNQNHSRLILPSSEVVLLPA